MVRYEIVDEECVQPYLNDILKKRMYNHLGGCVKKRINENKVRLLACLISVEDNSLLGYSLFCDSDVRENSLEMHVWVKPTFRNKGYGRKLIDILLANRDCLRKRDSSNNIVVYSMNGASNRLYHETKHSWSSKAKFNIEIL